MRRRHPEQTSSLQVLQPSAKTRRLLKRPAVLGLELHKEPKIGTCLFRGGIRSSYPIRCHYHMEAGDLLRVGLQIEPRRAQLWAKKRNFCAQLPSAYRRLSPRQLIATPPEARWPSWKELACGIPQSAAHSPWVWDYGKRDMSKIFPWNPV